MPVASPFPRNGGGEFSEHHCFTLNLKEVSTHSKGGVILLFTKRPVFDLSFFASLFSIWDHLP